LDYSDYVPDGYGTGDCVLIADGSIEVCDLKYGKGVLVSAEENPQMRLYALGAIAQFGAIYDLQTVRTTIIQPRLGNVSTEELTVADLVEWGEKVVRPAAVLAMEGKGEYVPGEHCRFCRAKAVCKARAYANRQLDQYEKKDPAVLTTEEIADILGSAEELQKWAKDVQDYALAQAQKGIKYQGWKVVEGRSNRTLTDKDSVQKILLNAGYRKADVLKPEELRPLGDLEKIVGKKDLKALIGHLIQKPSGHPALVPETDKRPEVNYVATEFENENFEEVTIDV
jgi:hypothetical protein